MAVNDLLTRAEGYLAVGDLVSSSSGTGNHDDTFDRWISAVSERIDEKCGPVVIRTISNEHHDGGERSIVPRYRPVSSITTIKEYDGVTATTLTAENLAGGTVTVDEYRIDPVTSWVHRRSNGSAGTFAPTRVILTYAAGRYANTAAVSAKFKEAASEMLVRLQKQYGVAWARGGDPFAVNDGIGFFKIIDPVINEMLGGERAMDGFA